ncbi:efflux RND transporter periplasmic adaptor subunit [soil metagenome]
MNPVLLPRLAVTLATAWLLAGALATLSGCGRNEPANERVAEGDYERGPHNGRLLRDGDFALEMTIFESGVPPQFRLYPYRDGRLLPPAQVQAEVELERLGGKTDHFSFEPQEDYLLGDGTVVEPHSFDVRVAATEGGREHRWAYASYEGRVNIPAAVAETSGIRTEIAGPATIRTLAPMMGSVAVDENRLARVRARFPGPVLEVRAGLGETVKAGQVLAIVENNESLRSYQVTAPGDGVVVARATNVGDVAGDAVMFEIADLSQVWVDLHAFGPDMARLEPGQPVQLTSTVGERSADAVLERILPVAAAGSQSVIARVRLPNPTGHWRPGLAVSAEVTIAEHPVPLAVKTSALQRFRDFTVVFARVGDAYEVRMLDLGRRDDEYVEVLGGIEAGAHYVTEQSFLIRADIEKSGASHDH